MDEIINDTQQEPNEKSDTRKKKKNILIILKFVIVGIVAALVIGFGDNSILRSCKETSAANRLRKEKEEYEQKISDTKEEINKFKEDKSQLEHQAREEYLMRKENEDVFIIE
ncbi:MAG: septum formation initiator family protein [Paludibacteraceae bacterium]|nr:septum formation initiator family protein [Paludibacteraceae bacterium]MBO7337392.1 septum formation initiator family protein [Paludibacteraceae bacterium]MBP5135864.1 septum formation initiator family protein [Paludibacteraceae bacterium]MBP5741945.1 septum formation initiator family protein [Paludibacteraceae bacterium]